MYGGNEIVRHNYKNNEISELCLIFNIINVYYFLSSITCID